MIEDFCQEYEIEPMDDAVSYYPTDLINQCTFESLIGYAYTEEDDLYGDDPKYMDPVYPGFNFKTYDTPEELSHAIFKGLVGKRLFAGFDVGRNENNSEIIIVDEEPSRDHLQSVRLVLTMKKTEFRKQFNTISKLFKILPIRMLNIDSTGIGSNIGEDLKKKFGSRINDMKFNSENKGEMATNLKLRMEDQTIAIPNERDLKRQIHSVKRVVSSNSVVKYEVEKTRMHHGDKFWALALASIAGKPAEMIKLRLVTAHRSIIDNTSRMLKQNPSRIFTGNPYDVGMPNLIGGKVEINSLVPPPKHLSEFALS
jgi:phage FluMu gp28-like protein